LLDPSAVGHQHERVQLAVVLHQGFAQVFEVGAVIVVVNKEDLTITVKMEGIPR